MVSKKQIFFDHEEDNKKGEIKTNDNPNANALWGFLEFGSEFHVPYGYPLTKEVVEDLNKTFQKDEEDLKK
ncbi:MAG TPA: hypothetical protein DCY20_10865 [Firmicutes bacterium]|nr:hypothetical protein [Bacillota bacterium]